MNLTAEQREAIMESVIIAEGLDGTECRDGSIVSIDQHLPKVLRDLLADAKPAWEVTRDRILGVQYAIELMEQPGGNDRKKEGYSGVFRTMLAEAGK